MAAALGIKTQIKLFFGYLAMNWTSYRLNAIFGLSFIKKEV